uniref:Ni/Fe hydrogenase subunit alpha n=1 Tax=Thermomicrobium roseum TaxID=500 RepID=A0A7C1X4Y5_THERO
MASHEHQRTIRISALARVEGEGALFIRVRDGQPMDVRLQIYEPPRFFEALLRGRPHTDAPDITARICGICPVAYQMSACNALENLFGITIPQEIRQLRLLLYYAEWIQSHTLHVVMLHAPDFLGVDNVVQMAQTNRDLVQRALQLKKAGNQLLALIGGREIHPVNVRVGGFYSVPRPAELRKLRDPLQRGLETALALARWVARFPFPDFEPKYEFVALRHPTEYAILDGHVVSSYGVDLPVSRFEELVVEHQVPHSTALHYEIAGRGSYLTGPLARFNLNFSQLSPLAQEVARETGHVPPLQNPFRSIVVRCLEIIHALEQSLALIERYEPPARPWVDYEVRSGIGFGASEAPRGLLYHRYEVGADGSIRDARIVPPTAQNQKRIEDDLRLLAPSVIQLPKDRATRFCEHVIRNYDPCISCATHFLRLDIVDGDQ